MSRHYTYKNTISQKYWNEQLKKVNSKLTDKTIELFDAVSFDHKLNCGIKKIYDKGKDFGLHIPELTTIVGNCLFESLESVLKTIGINIKHNVLRKSIATVFYLMGDCKNFASNGLTIKDMFTFSNDIKHVYCNITKKLYLYTFETMCVDLYSEKSWTRYQTHFILIMVSLLFKIKINIFFSSQHITEICHSSIVNDETVGNVYLGNIDELHYIPLVKNNSNKPECKFYVNHIEKFHKWAQKVSDKVGLYEDDPDDNQMNVD